MNHAPPVNGDASPMRLVIVYFGPFDVNSAIQAYRLGNDLTDMEWRVTFAGVGDPARMQQVGDPRFACVTHHDLPGVLEQSRHSGEPTVVYGWTPRENVRRATVGFASQLGVPYVVHLEDNERYLYETATGVPVDEARRRSEHELSRIAPSTLIHPVRWEQFIRGASGVTMIVDELEDFNFGSRPSYLFQPAIDTQRFRPDLEPPMSRAALGIDDDEFTIVYQGTVHYANHHEMLSLYLAIKLLQRRGRRVRLVRIGHTDLGGVDPRGFGALRDGVIELGPMGWRDIPAYLALADAFVQPGAPDAFNRYRLPSKLPECLAMGRPMILPACNLAHSLDDGENALLLHRGDGLEIAARIEQLLDDSSLRRQLASGARAFALARPTSRETSLGLASFLNRVVRIGGSHGKPAVASPQPVS